MPCRIDPKYSTILLIVIMMTTGTLNTVLRKVSYQMKGLNFKGEEETYNKAWISSLFMFIGEAFCLAIFYVRRLIQKKKAPPTYSDVTINQPSNTTTVFDDQNNTTVLSSVSHMSIYTDIGNEQVVQETHITNPASRSVTGSLKYWKFVFITACFATLDLVQTTAFNVAILYIPASIAQILRGFSMVFCLVLTIPLMKRRPAKWEIMGVIFAFLGLVLVGIAGAIQEENMNEFQSTFITVVGVVLVIAGQLFSATQYIMEEKALKSFNIDPLLVVGWEGVCGMILTMCVSCPLAHLIPGSDHGSLENYSNSMYMSFKNANLGTMNFFYILSILFLNWTSLKVSQVLTATHRTLFDNLRSLLIWIVMIIVYYCTVKLPKPYGEPITGYSVLELLGFGILFLGVVIYNNIKGFGEKAACSDKHKSKAGYTPLN